MKKTISKVTGISSLTDARYCAGMEVEYLGVPFDNQGIGAIDRNLFTSISGWIEGPVWVGEYEGSDFEKILEIRETYGLNFWQVSDADLAMKLKNQGIQVAFAMQEPDPTIWMEVIVKVKPEFLVLKANRNSSEEVREAKKISESIQVLIHPVSDISDAAFWKTHLPNVGLQLVSGEEERPGWMDLSGLQDILEYLEADNV